MQPVGAGRAGMPAGISLLMPDGTSNTLMVVEAGEPVIWTKPDDIPFDKDRPVPRLGGLFPGATHVLMGDGAIHSLKRDLPESTLKLLIMPADGTAIMDDVFDK